MSAKFSGAKLATKMAEKKWDSKRLAVELFQAGLIGASYQSVNNWLKGEYSPSVKNLKVLSVLFDESMDYFVDFKGVKK